MKLNGWDQINDLEKLINKNYGIKICKSEQVRKIIKLTTNQGVKALKIVNASYARYTFICEVMKYSLNNKFYKIPLALPTIDGKMGVKVKNGVLMMSDWVDARETNYNNDTDLEFTTEAIAHLHKSSEGFKPSTSADPRIMWSKWLKKFDRKCNEMQMFKKIAEGNKKKSEFDNTIIRYIDYFYDKGREAINDLKKSDYYKVSERSKKKKTFCHNDLGYHNVLINKDNGIYFIDFDNCILDMTIRDLGSFIKRYIRCRNLDLDKIYLILNTYNKVNPVSKAEFRIMKAFMKFPLEFWELGARYYKYPSKYSWSEKKYVQKIAEVIGDIPSVEYFEKNINSFSGLFQKK